MFEVSNLNGYVGFIILISTIIIILICDVTLMYYLRKFWVFKKHNVFQKRYAHITMIEGIVFVAQSIFYIIRIIIIMVYEGTIISPLFTAFIGFFWMFLRRILYCCLLWRFWMLLFEMSLTQIALNKKWINIINPKSCITSWFLLYKATAGNYRFMRNVTISLVIFITLFDIIPYRFIPVLFHISEDWKLSINIFNWIWNGLLPLGLLVIFLLLPPIRDNFYVSKEIKYLVVFAMLELIFVILYYIASYYKWMPSNDLLLFVLAVLYIGDASIVFIATCWVYNKVKYIVDCNLLVETNISRNDTDNNTSALTALLVSVNYSDPQRLYSDLLKTIENEQSQMYVEYILMDLFINEWVAFIEVIQFMQYIVKFMYENNIPVSIKLNPLYQVVKLPSNIPSSSIVHGMNITDEIGEFEQKEHKDDKIELFLLECKHITYKLYRKYFYFGAYFEVRHIPDSVKADLDQFMQHKDDWLGENEISLQWILDKMHDASTHICIALLKSFYRYQMKKQAL